MNYYPLILRKNLNFKYWSYKENEKYLARKKTKQDIYQKYGFHLIELDEADFQNLDDVLPRKLLLFEFQTKLFGGFLGDFVWGTGF